MAGAIISDDTRNRVKEHFPEEAVKQGVAIADAGRVFLRKGDQWPIVGQVSGDELAITTVYYESESDHLWGECSCEVPSCKHIVATAVVALETLTTFYSHTKNAAQMRAASEWLESIAAEVDESSSAAANGRRLLYLLSTEEDATLSVVIEVPATRSGARARRPLDFGYQPMPRWIPGTERRLLAELGTGFGGNWTYLRKIESALLRDLAKTERLFWNDDAVPLTWGKPKRCELTWQHDPATHEYRVSFKTELLSITARQNLYLDTKEQVLGELDAGMSPAVLGKLLSAPPIPHALLAATKISLRSVLGPAHPLTQVTQGEPELLKPRLSAMFRPGIDIRRDREAPLLEASIHYGDESFELGEWDPDRPMTRDMVFEHREALKLAQLMQRGHAPFDVRAREAFVRECKYVAERLIPQLVSEGWQCEVSEDFPFEPSPEPTQWLEELKPLKKGHSWFSFELGVVIDGETVPLLPILLQAIRKGELLLEMKSELSDEPAGLNVELPNGHFVYLSGARIKRWLLPLMELELHGLAQNRLLIPELLVARWEPRETPQLSQIDLGAARKKLDALVELAPKQEPKSFLAQLRPYQRQGLCWLRTLHEAGYGGLLADDMGLGKTVQVLAFIEGLRSGRKLPQTAPVLVVAPRSVVGHWEREAQRFAPKLRTEVHLGPKRKTTAKALQAAHIIITSYQTMLRDSRLVKAVPWTSIIFDEAQALKNPSALVRKLARGLTAQSRFAITGTPVENNLEELWSILDIAVPGFLGDKRGFQVVFRRPIEKYGNEDTLKVFQQRIRPFVLRRNKAEVELDLPAKSVFVEYVDLESTQRDLYESLRLMLDEEIRTALQDRGVNKVSLLVLDALLKLRQCCCDPRLVKLAQAREVTASAKLERLMSMLEELALAGKRVLLFSQFTTMLSIIEKECKTRGISTCKLTGRTRKRQEVIDHFQSGSAEVFLISLKAGGTGLNLTRADTVIHYDPWWNPAAEDQATDRAHRIGQDKNVFVYKLVARGTLEERITTLQESKRALTESTLRGVSAQKLARSDIESLYRELF